MISSMKFTIDTISTTFTLPSPLWSSRQISPDDASPFKIRLTIETTSTTLIRPSILVGKRKIFRFGEAFGIQLMKFLVGYKLFRRI